VNTLKKIGSIILKILIGFILLIIGYFLIALIFTIIPVNTDFKEEENGTVIYVASNGVHTDIIVPSESEIVNWNRFLHFDKRNKYIAFGWGDKDFYLNTPTWADLKFRTAFKAAFLFDDGILQVHGYSSNLQESKHCIKIKLSKDQLNQLNAYIYDSFEMNDLTEPIGVKSNENISSYLHYYEAKRQYSIFFTCNNWTSRGLKKAGIKNSVWAPFDRSVLFYLR